jgi:hypothetical protein
VRSRFILAILLLASIAASSQTVTVNYKVFGGAPGEVLAPFSIFQETPGKNVILGAPKEILVQDPANPAKPKTYTFLFWVVPGPPLANSWIASGGPTTNTEVVFKVPPGGAHTSAWYQLVGPGCPPSPAPCEQMSYVSAFSEDEDEPMAGTPITSVIPSGLWNPNQTSNYVSESNTNPVVITAKPSMENKKFHLWLPLSTMPISGNALTVPVQQTTAAIAFYHTEITDCLKNPASCPCPGPSCSCQQWDEAIGKAMKALQDAENLPPGPVKDEKVKQANKALQDAVAGEQACMKNVNKPKVFKAN